MTTSYHILNPDQCREVRTAPVALPDVERVEIGGHRIAYDANSMVAVEVHSDTIWRRLPSVAIMGATGDVAAVDALLYTREAPQFPFVPPLEQRHVVLNLTHACNLACRYCFVDRRHEDGPLRMTMQTAVDAIELLAPNAISFFGGEPLLCMDTLRAIVEQTDATWHVTTNATLLAEESAAWLAEHKFSAIVSIDGPPEIHNANRPERAGDGSYTDMLAGLTQLASAGIKPTLRATCHTADQLLPAAAHLNELMCDGLGSNVAVEPAGRTESCAGAMPDWDPRSWKLAYEHLATWMAEEARAGRRAIVHHISSYLRRLLTRSPQPSECGAGKNYFTVAPDGTIHACHREGTPIGTVDGGVDLCASAPWLDNRYYARPTCTTCPIRNVCGGGCRCASAANALPIDQPHATSCAFARMWFDAALWLMCELAPDELKKLI